MIIFYDKKTGKVVGTIDGRKHTEDHLKMWIGDKNETERIVVEWEPVAYYDERGKRVNSKSKRRFTADFEPKHEQKELFIDFDKGKKKVKDYKIIKRKKSEKDSEEREMLELRREDK